MKDKIMMFIIGALVGAILTGGGFLIFGQNNDNKMPDMGEMPQGQFQEGEGNARPGRGNGDGNQIDPNNQTEVNETTQTNEI